MAPRWESIWVALSDLLRSLRYARVWCAYGTLKSGPEFGRTVGLPNFSIFLCEDCEISGIEFLYLFCFCERRCVEEL